MIVNEVPMRSKLINDKVNQMLQALGTRVKEAAQTGGKKFQEFDDRYADAVRDKLMLASGDPRGITPLGTARNMGGAILGSPITRGPAMVVEEGVERAPQSVSEKLVGYGIPAASGAVRYGLPLAGVTAAGSTLMDIAGGLSPDEPEDEYILIRK